MSLQIFSVGGALRDALLNQAVKDKDWVVVGGTPEEMTQLGYTTVGKDFPVFLHPTSREEYALARTNAKLHRATKALWCMPLPKFLWQKI